MTETWLVLQPADLVRIAPDEAQRWIDEGFVPEERGGVLWLTDPELLKESDDV